MKKKQTKKVQIKMFNNFLGRTNQKYSQQKLKTYKVSKQNNCESFHQFT